MITIKQIAEIANVSVGAVGFWVRGVNRPSYNNMILLNKKINIPLTAWDNFGEYIKNNPNKFKIKQYKKMLKNDRFNTKKGGKKLGVVKSSTK